MEIESGPVRISVRRGDLTALPVDAIVNPANPRLIHGGGLAGAIVRVGGEVIQEESDRWVEEHGPLVPGRAAVTGAGSLPCRSVIHVAGPIWSQGEDNEGLLRYAVRAALDAAGDLGLRSIAVPAISAGIFGYPAAEATRVIAAEAHTWASSHRGAVAEICLIGYDTEVTGGFEDGLRRAAAG
jgi:O-acetyl-ADP-ribose deacetylase (regulator of RNase III)